MSKEKIVIAVLGVLTFLASIFFWRMVFLIFRTPQIENILTVGLGLFLSLIFLSVAVSLVSVLVESQRVIGAIFLFSSLASLILHPLTAPILFVSLMYFAYGLHRQIKFHTKFSVSHLFSPPLKTLVVLLALILSFDFYFFAGPRFREARIEIPDPIFQQILKMGLGGVGEGESLEWLQKEAREEGLGERLPEKFPEIFEKGQISPEMFQQFFGKEGLEGGPLLGTAQIKKEIEDQVNAILGPYLGLLPILFSTSIFLTLRLLSPLITAVAVLALGIVIKILLKLRALTLKTETVEAERLGL